jgi:hypothetical protein
MRRNLGYYRNLNLRRVARKVPRDKEQRLDNEFYYDALKSIALRYETESISSQDLLEFLGDPDSHYHEGQAEAWGYKWRGEHMGREIHGTFAFLVVDERVVGLERRA